MSQQLRLTWLRLIRRIRGATGVEYALLLTLLGASAIGAVAATGVNLDRVLGRAGEEIASGLCEGVERDGACLPILCTPAAVEGCPPTANASGERICAADGTAWGSCSFLACDSGHFEAGGSCLPHACTPDTVQGCVPYANANGSQSCASNGSQWSACDFIACDVGYHSDGGACASNTQACGDTTGSGEQHWNGNGWDSCQMTACNSGYHAVGTDCASNTQACADASGSGTQQWNGSGWDDCQMTACNSGYHAVGATCASSTQACADITGSGTQQWNGSTWDGCQMAVCNSGYHLTGTACASSTQACTDATGSGTQHWNGSGWGSCQMASCSASYHLAGTACVSNTQACSAGNGSGTQQWAGSTWGTCTLTACNSGYTLSSSGTCLQNCSQSSQSWGNCSGTSPAMASGAGTWLSFYNGSYDGSAYASCNNGTVTLSSTSCTACGSDWYCSGTTYYEYDTCSGANTYTEVNSTWCGYVPPPPPCQDTWLYSYGGCPTCKTHQVWSCSGVHDYSSNNCVSWCADMCAQFPNDPNRYCDPG